MKQIQPDLWQTETENPAPGLTTHAYLLTRDDGNILFYNTGHKHEIDEMDALGGVAYQYLSHQDELGETLIYTRERFNAKLGGHVNEQAKFTSICPPDTLFDRRQTLLGNVEVILTPGHSPGSTSFLAKSPFGKRYLFTGDTLFLNKDREWQAGYIPGYSQKADLIESLRILQELEPDMVISSAFIGDPGYQEMPRTEWKFHVNLALEKLMKLRGAVR